jgi:hypothetical protein
VIDRLVLTAKGTIRHSTARGIMTLDEHGFHIRRRSRLSLFFRLPAVWFAHFRTAQRAGLLEAAELATRMTLALWRSR